MRLSSLAERGLKMGRKREWHSSGLRLLKAGSDFAVLVPREQEIQQVRRRSGSGGVPKEKGGIYVRRPYG